MVLTAFAVHLLNSQERLQWVQLDDQRSGRQLLEELTDIDASQEYRVSPAGFAAPLSVFEETLGSQAQEAWEKAPVDTGLQKLQGQLQLARAGGAVACLLISGYCVAKSSEPQSAEQPPLVNVVAYRAHQAITREMKQADARRATLSVMIALRPGEAKAAPRPAEPAGAPASRYAPQQPGQQQQQHPQQSLQQESPAGPPGRAERGGCCGSGCCIS
eukprot:TRINITY_DN6188_c0_g1_i1.p2 TRINITY_DN6188_c0_g1~~TRINITY_DN6188_c0_g1_i1.p2  ORF type:complete len:247 (+),score=66.31 TRINITY_DN6188_c0_g1_i1:95-742(+)